MPRWLIVIVIVGPLTVIGVATMMIMKSAASGPLAKDDAAGVLSLPRPPSSPAGPNTVPVANAPTAPTATITPRPQKADQATMNEINRLRAENEQLKKQINAKPAPPPQSSLPVNATPVVDDSHPDPEAFARFARRFANCISIQLKQANPMSLKDNYSPESQEELDCNVTCTVASADIKKTDSVITPLVGVVELSETATTSIKYVQSGLVVFSSKVQVHCVITMTYKQRRWMPIKEYSKCVYERQNNYADFPRVATLGEEQTNDGQGLAARRVTVPCGNPYCPRFCCVLDFCAPSLQASLPPAVPRVTPKIRGRLIFVCRTKSCLF
ncbi:MAG: hypothetical protein ABSB74_15925 [Tepidisphaeraceae bacterium]